MTLFNRLVPGLFFNSYTTTIAVPCFVTQAMYGLNINCTSFLKHCYRISLFISEVFAYNIIVALQVYSLGRPMTGPVWLVGLYVVLLWHSVAGIHLQIFIIIVYKILSCTHRVAVSVPKTCH